MATTTVSGSTVVFSNSTAAANLSTSLDEDSSLTYAFDVLAASGGGATHGRNCARPTRCSRRWAWKRSPNGPGVSYEPPARPPANGMSRQIVI